KRGHVGLRASQGPVVQVGRVVEVLSSARGVDLDVEHPLGDHAAFAKPRQACVLNGVLEVEEQARLHPRIALVHQYGPSSQQITMPLDHEIESGVEERVAGADEGGQRLALRRDERFLEHDALVARQHRLADADQTVTVAHWGGHVRDLVAACLALPDRATKPLESFEEEGLDVVWLQAARLGALHFLADAVDATRIHGVMSQGAFLQQVPQLLAVEGVLDYLHEASADLGPLAVAHRLDQQISKWFAFELKLAEDVENLAPERLSSFLQLVQQRAIDVSLAGFLGDEVPEMADLGLTDSVDAPESLLDSVGVPGQVIVHHQM